MLAQSVPLYRTIVQDAQEPLAGKGLIGEEQSLQAGVREPVGTRPDTKDSDYSITDSDIVWCRAVVAQAEGMVQELLKATQ